MKRNITHDEGDANGLHKLVKGEQMAGDRQNQAVRNGDDLSGKVWYNNIIIVDFGIW